MPELVFFRRGEEVLRVGLERQRVVIGRGEKCDVVIPDPDVSRQHVALSYDGTHCKLEDLSGKGTLVAGTPMHQGELADGSDLTLGKWRAVFRLRSGAESADATGVGRHTSVQQRPEQSDGFQPAQVRVKQGANELIHEITGESFTIGKDPANALVVQDRFISSKHLQVTRREKGFHVVDLNSTNGTFLGGVRIFEVEVPLHTVLRVGETELILEPLSLGRQTQTFHGIIGDDPSVRQLVELIERVAPSNAAVAILGESGTGKELVARALHVCSPRAQPGLHARQLRGHLQGAHRERAVRPREGRLHRRRQAAQGRLRGGPRRHPLPGRDRRAAAGACRPSCCACWRAARSSAWAPAAPSTWTCAWWPPPTAICWPPRARAASARTCTTGCASSR